MTMIDQTTPTTTPDARAAAPGGPALHPDAVERMLMESIREHAGCAYSQIAEANHLLHKLWGLHHAAGASPDDLALLSDLCTKGNRAFDGVRTALSALNMALGRPAIGTSVLRSPKPASEPSDA